MSLPFTYAHVIMIKVIAVGALKSRFDRPLCFAIDWLRSVYIYAYILPFLIRLVTHPYSPLTPILAGAHVRTRS